MAEPLDITTPDGRTLEVLDSGGEGFPLLYHSGSPSAAVQFRRLESAAGAQGMRMITYSRPGYGRSSPYPVPGAARVRDDLNDVTTILDELDVEEFVTLGWSGGGPRALACAALLPGRCRAASTVAGAAPYDAVGLDWFAGMGESNVEEYAAAREGMAAYEAYLARELQGMAEITSEQLSAGLGDLTPPVDVAALTPDLADHLSASFRHACHQGVTGTRDDGLAMFNGWGFDLAAIAVPVAIWHGSVDAMVPLGHGRWLADHVPGARVHLLDGEGHVSLVARLDEILSELRDLAGLEA